MRKQFASWALALVIGGLCLTGSVYYLTSSAIDRLMKVDSMEKSTMWTNQIVKNVPEIEAIANGQQPSEAARQYLQFVKSSPSIDHFDIYNKEGDLQLESEKIGEFRSGGVALKDHNGEALEAAESGKPLVVIDLEVEDGKTKTLAETYLPIMQNGKMVGVASVYIDETDLAAHLKSKFALTSLLVSGLTIVGFAIPAFGGLKQLRRRMRSDEQVAYLAKHDVLTGLPNRRTMEKSLDSLLSTAEGKSQLAAVHFVDIDFFKDINDRFGHSFGDEVLKAFANRLSESLGPDDHVSRFGGDEFLVVHANLASIEEIGSRTRDLVNNMARPYTILEKSMVVTASIGTGIYPENGTTAEELLANADTALYAVKMRGRNGQSFFEPSLKDKKRRRSEIEMLIREHLAAKTFELHFQPLYRLEKNALKSFEALLRMKDNSGKYISPAEFVPIAEDIGLIDDIGCWALLEACKTATTWPEHLEIAVNLSAVQFRRKTVCGAVERALKESGITPRRLLLEVTESLLMTDVEGVLEQLNVLKGLGTRLAMDDFGTGYSSLSYMVRFPFDRIKIDRSFVTQLQAGDRKSKQVVQTIIALGHNMDMAVTAEGVETESQASALKLMKCDDAQGFLYSKPVPAADVAALIMKDFQRLSTPLPQAPTQSIRAG
jgi:diguanylate cyclase (GGDEF)-like protein